MRPASKAAGGPTQLTVGLYPYVPRVQQFQQAIQTAWAQVQPKVSLTFLTDKEWDGGYEKEPPPSADVYVFDAMFFEYFQSQNWLEPLQASEVQNLGDFVPYAIDGVQVGNAFYAIPQLGCANILFYLNNDVALAKATTLSQVNAALSTCTYTSQIPPDRRGLMLDMKGGTTNAALYLDAAHSITNQYPMPLPSPGFFNKGALANMQSLLAMASFENATQDPPQSYGRGAWFGNGWGRAMIGFTEDMSAMNDTTRQNVGFKVMPLSDTPHQPLFYADVIGVNTTTKQRGTRALAVQLANVMAASSTMVASIGPDANNKSPQYLMSTRPSVFQNLQQRFPIYKDMYALTTQNKPIAFKLNANARKFVTTSSGPIRSAARQNYPCGCDFPAGQSIPNNPAAPAICQATCALHGGWNGQWTNQPPAAPAGTSVCGCKACPL